LEKPTLSQALITEDLDLMYTGSKFHAQRAKLAWQQTSSVPVSDSSGKKKTLREPLICRTEPQKQIGATRTCSRRHISHEGVQFMKKAFHANHRLEIEVLCGQHNVRYSAGQIGNRAGLTPFLYPRATAAFPGHGLIASRQAPCEKAASEASIPIIYHVSRPDDT
jgi:hypothetical protein